MMLLQFLAIVVDDARFVVGIGVLADTVVATVVIVAIIVAAIVVVVVATIDANDASIATTLAVVVVVDDDDDDDNVDASVHALDVANDDRANVTNAGHMGVGI